MGLSVTPPATEADPNPEPHDYVNFRFTKAPLTPHLTPHLHIACFPPRTNLGRRLRRDPWEGFRELDPGNSELWRTLTWPK